MAICYFGKVNFCDVVLFETGLGGRFDSTNVIHPVLTIITNIGHDHMHILGNTLGEIAYEKAGIIKSGVPVITGVQDEEALEVIQNVAKENHANLYELGKHFTALHKQSKEDGEQFDFTCPFAAFEDLQISMKGIHQVGNAALALMAVMYVKTYLSFLIEEEEIRTGLREAYWIGRFEKLQSNPDIIIDGAHNPEGIESLVKTVEAHYKDKNVIVLFTALGDKQLHNMVGQLETIADEIIFTTFAFDRAISADKLASYSQKESKLVFENWKEAIDTKVEMIGENDVFIITGSLYFISEVRKYIREKN